MKSKHEAEALSRNNQIIVFCKKCAQFRVSYIPKDIKAPDISMKELFGLVCNLTVESFLYHYPECDGQCDQNTKPIFEPERN